MVGRSRVSVSRGSNRVEAVQNRFELLESLPPRALKILGALGAGNAWKDAAKIAECCKSDVTYWKDKLVAMGALRLRCQDVFKIFALTPYGSKLLTGSEGAREVVGLEDYPVKFGVVESELCRIDWRKLGSPRNWVKLGVKIGDVRVVRTSRHVIIHPGRLRGFDVTELKVQQGRIIERVKMILENRFGMVLSAESVSLHKLMCEFYTAEAAELSRYGSFSLKDRKGEILAAINDSPPAKGPHEEYVEEVAHARMQLPLRLAQVEQKLDAVHVDMSRLVGVLERLLNVEEAAEPLPRGDPDYVC